MARTDFQRTICRLLADHRIASGESYVAGGAALNELIAAPRISRDVLRSDGRLFNGTVAELRAASDSGGLVFHAGSIRGALPGLKGGRLRVRRGWR